MASIVSGVIEKINVGGTSHAIASTAYGYCTTAANESAKTVEMTDFQLEQGVTIHIKFQYDNTALTPTLNVNGTGAKPIALGGSKIDVDGGIVGWRADDIVTFTYDGNNRWVINNSAYATMAGSILSGNIHPTIVKEWTDSSFYGANISGQDVHDLSTFWMLSVKPDSWYEPWVVRFKITTTCPAAANYYSVTYCMYSGRADGMVVFNWNERYDHAHYYTNIRTLKRAGFDAGLGHAIGINLYASNNYTNANYYRSFKLEYYDCDNCTVTILDNPIKWANWPDGTTTNYNGNNNANAVDRGLQESGDANSYDLLQMSNTYIKNGSFRFPGVSLFGYDREGHAQPFSLYQSGYNSYTTSISNKVTRIYNNNGIDWTRGIHYNASGGSWAENTDMNITTRLAQSAVDLRYTDNCVSTANTTLSMISRKAVYIRGTLDENGLFHVAPLDVTYSNATYCRTWTQDIPTEADNYVYWFIGYPYATSAYQVNLYLENPLYWFHDGKFQKYIEHAESADGVKQTGTTTTGEYPVLFKNTGDTADETASVKYSNGNNATATANLAFTFNPNTGNLTIPELTIAKKDDNYGIFPHTSNYNQIGKSNLYWYRAYVTNYYGTTSHITNWDSGKNIGTEKTSSAAATKGSVNFYNVCAAGGTTTKTTLAANDSTNSNITINLPSTSGTLALVGAAPTAHEHNYLVPVSGSVSSGQNSPNNTLALGIKKYFDDNKTTIPRDKLISFNVSAYSNAVYAFGHFISGYNDGPYGGFYAVHYQTPRFLGIAAGSYEESLLARINVTNAITSGQVMIADGTNGKIKTSGYTIAKSVPSDAVFTDHYAWGDITSKPTTLSGYGITDAASSSHSHTLKIGNKSLSVSTSEQTWSVHDILLNSTSIGTDTSWDQTAPGAYYVASGAAFSGDQHPGTNQNAPYSYGGLYVLRAGNGGAAQFYISDHASNGTNQAYGIRYRSGWNVINHTRENGTSPWKSWATILDDKNYSLFAWKRPASITTEQVLISSGTDGTTTTRAILNNTSKGALGWNSAGTSNADNLRFMTVNTLAYWNGAYAGTSSNLTYYSGGAFGTMAKETATDYAKLASPTFTGTPKSVTPSNNSDNKMIATKEYVDNYLAVADAMVFKGTLGTGGTITALPATHSAGDTYRVITAGTWAGKTCVVGDLVICIKDGTTAADADWTSVETNEDGAIIGPAAVNSTTDNAIVRWDSTAGRVIQNSGITIDDNNNITSNGGNIYLNSYSIGNETGIFFRNGFTSGTSKYNASILIYDHNGSGNTPDGISINGYDGISFCTGSNDRLERFRINQSGNIIPFVSNTYNIGASNALIATIYASTYDGAILKLHQGNSANPSLTGNARIEFDYSDGQPVIISYTPNDSYRSPAGLKLMGGSGASPAWFEVEGGIYTNSYYHIDANSIDNGSWLTGVTGKAPTATTTDGNTTYSGAVIGTSILTLGNNKVGANSASGANNNAQGYLRLYSNGSGYAQLTSYNGDKTRIYPEEGISLPYNKIGMMFRADSGSYYTYFAYENSGNEALVAATQNSVTSFIFVNGESYANVAAARWTKLTGSGASGEGNAPGLQIKQNCVSIGELIPSGTSATYKLNVNGISNFKGNMTSTGSFYTSGRHISLISGGETDQFIDFAYAADPTASTAPGASWRIGALNSGSGDSNYFVIQTGGSATNATTWNNALRLGMNTYDAGFGGNVYPLTNNNKTLGTSSLKWSNVYATTFTGDLTGNATSADSVKWFMNRGGSTVTISDGPWAHGQTGSGGTNAATVWHQRWKQSGLTYTPSGGSATTLTDSGDMVLWLAQSTTSNALTVNMAIDGIIYAMGGFKGNLNGQAATVARATFGDSSNAEHNANNIKSNGMWYYTSNGPATSLGATVADGALYSQGHSSNWAAQIAQDYRDGSLFVRGLKSGTWQSWYAIPKFTTTTGGLGGTTQPVYIDTNGELQIISYTIAKSVPSDAKFTDHEYDGEKGITLSSGKFGHSNTAITAQTTQAVYPIKIDAYGHITAYGSAQTILSIGTGANNAAAGNHTHSTYVLKSGDTMTGALSIKASGSDANDSWLNFTDESSTVYGIGIRRPFATYGLQFKSGSTYYPIGYFSSAPSDGKIVIADGDKGKIKTSSYTIAKSVPSDAKFTDTTSFTITANATDGLWDLTGTNGTNAVTYALAPYSSKGTTATFYTAATNPTLTTRLNYDGYLYATKLYSNGTEVSVSGHTHSYLSSISWSGDTNLKLKQSVNGATATDVLQFVAGSNITLAGDSGKLTITGTPDTKNTAGSTNSTSKLYLIGATSQGANPTTNSYQYTYVTEGFLSSTKLGLNMTGTEKVHLEWNNTDQALEFIFT